MEQASLDKFELDKFEATLSGRIAELEEVLRHRDLIAIEQTADQLDEVQQASHRALATSHFDRGSHQLGDARNALRRLQEGTFGICAQCEEEIPLKRLLAVPWTAFCIHCQEEVDRVRKDTRGGGNSGGMKRRRPAAESTTIRIETKTWLTGFYC